MNKGILKEVILGAKSSIKQHSPAILTGVGIVGMVSTTIMAVKATPKAIRLKEQEESNRRNEARNHQTSYGSIELSKKETVKLVWRCYIPSVITGTFAIACLIGSNSISHRRNAVLATAYTLSESALKVYKDKVVETLGEKKERTIRDAIAKDVVDRTPVKEDEIINTGHGNTLCLDAWSGQVFRSDIDKIKQAITDLNHRMLTDSYISVNDVYYELGLNNGKFGDSFGWNINDGPIKWAFSSQLSRGEVPCLVLDFQVSPKEGFDQW